MGKCHYFLWLPSFCFAIAAVLASGTAEASVKAWSALILFVSALCVFVTTEPSPFAEELKRITQQAEANKSKKATKHTGNHTH